MHFCPHLISCLVTKTHPLKDNFCTLISNLVLRASVQRTGLSTFCRVLGDSRLKFIFLVQLFKTTADANRQTLNFCIKKFCWIQSMMLFKFWFVLLIQFVFMWKMTLFIRCYYVIISERGFFSNANFLTSRKFVLTRMSKRFKNEQTAKNEKFWKFEKVTGSFSGSINNVFIRFDGRDEHLRMHVQLYNWLFFDLYNSVDIRFLRKLLILFSLLVFTMFQFYTLSARNLSICTCALFFHPIRIKNLYFW